MPDVVLRNDAGRSVFVEVRVSHEVDQVKMGKLHREQTDCVEIDLRDIPRFLSYAELTTFLSGDNLPSVWLYNHADFLHLQALEEAKRLAAIEEDRKRREFLERLSALESSFQSDLKFLTNSSSSEESIRVRRKFLLSTMSEDEQAFALKVWREQDLERSRAASVASSPMAKWGHLMSWAFDPPSPTK